jgi:hypothetical protein
MLERLLDQVLEFILDAPEDEFLRFLEDSGHDPIALAREAREAITAACLAGRLGQSVKCASSVATLDVRLLDNKTGIEKP